MASTKETDIKLNGFFQNGYVVADIDDAMARLQHTHGAIEFRCFEPEIEAQTPEGFGLVHVKVALAWIGTMQIELIQPISGYVRHYAAILDGGDAIRHHHIGLRVEDWDATLEEIQASTLPIVYEGHFGDVKFIYVDATATVGHQVEFLSATPEGWEMLGWPDDLPAPTA